MISPVLEENSTQANAYFPQGIWYELATNSFAFDFSVSGSTYMDLYTPLTKANVHVFGGNILPLQAEGVMNTAESRKSPYTLFVAFNEMGEADGNLFIDDGEQMEIEDYIYLEFDSTLKSPTSGVLTSKVIKSQGK